jgi:hypothetical protein
MLLIQFLNFLFDLETTTFFHDGTAIMSFLSSMFISWRIKYLLNRVTLLLHRISRVRFKRACTFVQNYKIVIFYNRFFLLGNVINEGAVRIMKCWFPIHIFPLMNGIFVLVVWYVILSVYAISEGRVVGKSSFCFLRTSALFLIVYENTNIPIVVS